MPRNEQFINIINVLPGHHLKPLQFSSLSLQLFIELYFNTLILHMHHSHISYFYYMNRHCNPQNPNSDYTHVKFSFFWIISRNGTETPDTWGWL